MIRIGGMIMFDKIKKHKTYYLIVILFYILYFILSRWPIFDYEELGDVIIGFSALDKILLFLNIDMHQRPLQIYTFSMISHYIVYIVYSIKIEKPHHFYKLLIYSLLTFIMIPVF